MTNENVNTVVKKILIVCRWFYPENSARALRATELAKEFARQGHNVTVITSERNEEDYLTLECRDKIRIKNFGKLKFPLIKESKKKYFNTISRIISRVLQILFEYPSIEIMWKIKRALREERHYDLLITIAVPHSIHWGTAWARNSKHSIAKIWIADCGDPYMGNNIDTFKKLFYFKYLENWFLKKADFVSVPFEGAKDGYYEKYRYKIIVIPQGFKFEDFNVLISEYKKNEIPTFAYAGGFIKKFRDPRNFIKYLISLNREFKFIIYTYSPDIVKKYAEISKNRIEIYGIIPRSVLLKELSKMDFMVNIENETKIALPSKLIDYSLTGRPILSLPSNTVDKKLINDFLNGNYSNRLIIKNQDNYRIENVCKQFLSLIDYK